MTAADGKAVARWSFDVLKDLELSCFAASAVLPLKTHCRGAVTLDEKRVELAESFDPAKIALGYRKVTNLTLTSPGKPALALAFPSATQVLVQDNRKWSQDYVVRIDAGPTEVKAGESYALEMTLSAPDGTRRAEIPAQLVNGRLSFTADIARDRNQATCLYKIVRR